MQLRAASGADMFELACCGNSAGIGPVEPKAYLETSSRNLPDFVRRGLSAEETVVCIGTLPGTVSTFAAVYAFGTRTNSAGGGRGGRGGCCRMAAVEWLVREDEDNRKDLVLGPDGAVCVG